MGLRQDPAFSTASCFSKAVLDFKACINYRLYIPTVSLLDSMLAKKKKKIQVICSTNSLIFTVTPSPVFVQDGVSLVFIP